MNITTAYPDQQSDQPVILEPRKIWSQVLVWLIMGMATSGIAWAAIAQIEQTVPTTGKLEPQRAVQEIKAPTGGVVRTIAVQDGQVVKKGQPLLGLDPTASEADLKSLIQLRASLVKENQLYDSAAAGSDSGIEDSSLKTLLRLRNQLITENHASAQLTDKTLLTGEFNPNQQQLLNANRAENQARIAAANLQIQASQKQLAQTQTQLATAQQSLVLTESIRDRIRPVVAAGAIPLIQLQQQEQEVLGRRAEVEKLQGEQQHLQVLIAQSQEQLQQVTATTQKENLTKVADNQKRIAEIDTQLSRTQLDNQRKITDLDGSP
jgi:hemolysin D